jgi:outer membrane protein OmpA-like peptidoglycan-associated protein
MMVPTSRRTANAMIYELVAAVFLSLLPNVSGGWAQQTPDWPAPSVTYMPGARGHVSGPIMSRRGNDLLVRDEPTHDLNLVTLAPTTAITQRGGFLNLRRRARDATILIVGLVIVVNGSGGDHGNLVAREINFHDSSLRTATQTSAGVIAPGTQQRETAAVAPVRRDSVAAGARFGSGSAAAPTRISNLAAYSTKVMATIDFAVGSTALSVRAKRTLDELVSKGQGLDGYIVQVVGFADSTGSIERNQRLSAQRADAVVAYLTRTRGLPVARFVSAKGLAASHPAASNGTAAGRARNRRVEVRVMVNGGSRPSTAS